MVKKLTLVVFFLAMVGSLQGCDQIGRKAEEPKDGPFGIYMGMPLEELFGPVRRDFSLPPGFMLELDGVPRPHPLFNEYFVQATILSGVCGIRALVSTHKHTVLKSIFDEVLSQLEEKYGPYVIEEMDEPVQRAVWDVEGNSRAQNGVRRIELTNEGGPWQEFRAFDKARVVLKYEFENADKCEKGSSDVL